MKIPFALWVLFFAATGSSFAQHKYMLEGSVPGKYNNLKVYMYLYKNDKVAVVKKDSSIVRNAAFSFKGEMAQPGSFGIISMKIAKGNTPYQYFILDEGTNKMEAEATGGKPELRFKFPNSRSNMINSKLDSVSALYHQRYREANNIKGAFGLPIKEGEELRAEQISLLEKYPNDYASLILLYNLSLFDDRIGYLDTIMQHYSKLDKSIKESGFGKQFAIDKAEIYKAYNASRMSQPVPIFTVKKFDGSAFINSSLKGKPYIIAFSATWCVPCQQYQPELQKLYNKYHPQGLETVYFNMDDNMKIWADHIKKKKLSWINVSERVKWASSKISKQFNIKSLPVYLVIDKEGKIAYNSKQLNDLDHLLLEEYIKKAMK